MDTRYVILIKVTFIKHYNSFKHTCKKYFSFLDSIQMLVDGESYGILNSNISHYYNLKPIEPHIKMQKAAWELGSSNAPFDKMVIMKRMKLRIDLHIWTNY